MGPRREALRVYSENRAPENNVAGVKRLQEEHDIPEPKRGAFTLRPRTDNILVARDNKCNVVRKAAETALCRASEDADLFKIMSITRKDVQDRVSRRRQKNTNVMVDREQASPEDFYVAKRDLPRNVPDIDKRVPMDPNCEPHYAHDSFEYLRERELYFRSKPYLVTKGELTAEHRALLVDWMVDVQESFELNHETLYMAVKIVDRYLSVDLVCKSSIQLLGATAMMIAAKIDERIPPSLEDFVFICDNAYTNEAFLKFERKVLNVLDFEVMMPLSYSFLRRYCRSVELTMEEMTLARFILECSLMEYEFIVQRESKMAAASLLLALEVLRIDWNETLTYYTSYQASELEPLKDRLNVCVQEMRKRAEGTGRNRSKTIINKYSHNVFYNVATCNFPPIRC